MAWIEELVANNARYYETRRRAQRHPRANGFRARGPMGTRRDGLDAKATREHKEGLNAIGVSTWR